MNDTKTDDHDNADTLAYTVRESGPILPPLPQLPSALGSQALATVRTAPPQYLPPSQYPPYPPTVTLLPSQYPPYPLPSEPQNLRDSTPQPLDQQAISVAQPVAPLPVAPVQVTPVQVTPTTVASPAPRWNSLAIASFVCSLLGISLLGVIFGHIALRQIRRANGRMHGRGLAIAGLILGYIPIVIFGVIIVLIFGTIGLLLIVPFFFFALAF